MAAKSDITIVLDPHDVNRNLLDSLSVEYVRRVDAERGRDKLAELLAEQTLLNEELKVRMEWYRNMYYLHGGDKIDDLIAEHRFNSAG